MKRSALRIVLGDRPVAYHPILARITGRATAGMLLSQLLYWDGVMSSKNHDWDGWFWKISAELMEETGMSRSELETARNIIAAKGFAEIAVRGNPPKTFYRIDHDAIEAAIESLDEEAEPRADRPRNERGQFATIPQIEFAETRQIKMPEDGKFNCGEPANQFAETPQNNLPKHGSLLLQEITSEIKSAEYQEKTSSAAADVVLDAEGFQKTIEQFEARFEIQLTPELREKFAELWNEVPDRAIHNRAMDNLHSFSKKRRLRKEEPTRTLSEYALIVINIASRRDRIERPAARWAELGIESAPRKGKPRAHT